MIGQSFKPVPYRLPLKTKKFAVKEPNFSNRMVKIDMAIVPVVGIDKLDKRIGFGKGMYDRFYEKLKSKPIVIFVQRVKCFTKDRITDAYDISADFYITP